MPKTKVIFPHKLSVNLGDIHLEIIKDYMHRFNRDQSTAIRELLLHGINYVYYIGDKDAAVQNQNNNNHRSTNEETVNDI